MSHQRIEPKFKMGQVVMTEGVREHCEQVEFDQFWKQSLNRHALCDWGDVDQHDKQENDFSLKNGFRLVSSYQSSDLPKIWIITEGDRAVTTILFPDEY